MRGNFYNNQIGRNQQKNAEKTYSTPSYKISLSALPEALTYFVNNEVLIDNSNQQKNAHSNSFSDQFLVF